MKTKYLYYKAPGSYLNVVRVYRKEIGRPTLKFFLGSRGWVESNSYPKLTKEFKIIPVSEACKLDPNVQP